MRCKKGNKNGSTGQIWQHISSQCSISCNTLIFFSVVYVVVVSNVYGDYRVLLDNEVQRNPMVFFTKKSVARSLWLPLYWAVKRPNGFQEELMKKALAFFAFIVLLVVFVGCDNTPPTRMSTFGTTELSPRSCHQGSHLL